jgi:tRNA acetyltransferase TAN1
MEVNCPFNLLLTTQLGFEQLVRTAVETIEPGAKVTVSPRGYKGLVGVVSSSPEELARSLLESSSYVEKAFVVKASCLAEPGLIAREALRIARESLPRGSSFAARTVRRGKHSFTSIDVNIAVGSAIVSELNLEVDLETPDYVVFTNIIDECAYISIIEGEKLRGKELKRKPSFYRYFNKLIVAQEPYISEDPEASYKMGVRIGRGLQNFEIGDYYVALIRPVEALPLKRFIDGLIEGIESRFRVEEKSYGRKPVKTRVHVYEMHNLVAMLRDHPIIILEPEGEVLSRVSDKIVAIFSSGKRPVLLLGSREGVPSGLFRFSTLVVDVMPGITLSTEYALPVALGGIASILMGDRNEDYSAGSG